MPAWNHTRSWNDQLIRESRQYVAQAAPSYKGKKVEDCADLSQMFLIDFAAARGLPLTFQDNDGRTYASWAGGQSPYRENPITGTRYGKTWSNVQEYTKAVQARTGTHSLWKHDLGAAKRPEPGDLMIMVKVQRVRMLGQDIEIFEEGHAALVYAAYGPGVAHPLKAHKDIPDFPGHDVAKKEVHQFEYFRGRAVSKNPWQIDREADTADHVDYLNSRSDAKRIGELIYFASAQDMRNDGFEFRWWADHVFL